MYFGCAATIECSYQPLDISFHPTVSTIVAAALVDGTVEVHDYSEMVLPPSVASMPKVDNNDDEEENDTIVSSTQVHYAPTTMAKAVHEPSTSVSSSSSSPSCRAIQFSNDGTTLWTGGNDGSIVALDTKQICTFTATTPSKKEIFQYRIANAGYNGTAPIQVLYEIPERNLLASGDDVGCVRLWDRRMLDTTSAPPLPPPPGFLSNNNNNRKASPRGCVADWKVHDDYVSAILHSASSSLGESNMENIDATDNNNNSSGSDNTLLSTSADGTLVVYDLRMTSSSNGNNVNNSNNPSHETSLPYGVLRQSDPQDDELLSLCIMKNGRKVVCGTTEGVLSIFSYGTWGDVSDRYPGHPSSIDAILKIDEDTILTGSSDGLIRVVSIQPNQFVGVIGDNHEGFPIEQLQFTCDRSYVGSVTHDNFIRLWDARMLDENYDDDIDDDDEIDLGNNNNNNDGNVKMAAVPMKTDNDDNDNKNSDEEWEDMDEDDDDNSDDDDDAEDDDDDDDMDSDNDKAETKRGKKGSTKNNKRASRLKSERERFFDDL
jgi:WD repeat-containing protein 55